MEYVSKSLTYVGSRENGKREFANSFTCFHEGEEITVVVDGRENRIQLLCFFFDRNIGRNSNFACSKKKSWREGKLMMEKEGGENCLRGSLIG